MEKQLLPDLDKITYKEFFENSQFTWEEKLELSSRYAISCIEWVVNRSYLDYLNSESIKKQIDICKKTGILVSNMTNH